MPKVYHFELDNEDIYEVVAMNFKDACVTLEENHPEIYARRRHNTLIDTGL